MFGNGEPVIILHGVFGMLDNWQIFAKKLADEFWVSTIDLRNHGRSPHSDIFNYEVMISDVIEFLNNNHIKQPHIIGHSMGGKLAMHLALEHPEYINKLVIVDIGIKKYISRHDEIFKALCSLNLKSYQKREEIDRDLKKTISNWNIRQFLMKNINRNKDKEGFKWKMNLNIIKDNYETIIQKITSDFTFEGDTIFIKGENSDFILEKDKPEILDLFPNAKFETIPNAGHWVHAEQTDKLIKITKDFLKLDLH